MLELANLFCPILHSHLDNWMAFDVGLVWCFEAGLLFGLAKYECWTGGLLLGDKEIRCLVCWEKVDMAP